MRIEKSFKSEIALSLMFNWINCSFLIFIKIQNDISQCFADTTFINFGNIACVNRLCNYIKLKRKKINKSLISIISTYYIFSFS